MPPPATPRSARATAVKKLGTVLDKANAAILVEQAEVDETIAALMGAEKCLNCINKERDELRKEVKANEAENIRQKEAARLKEDDCKKQRSWLSSMRLGLSKRSSLAASAASGRACEE